MLDSAFPVAIVERSEDCKHVRKYREVRKEGAASAMMTPSRDGEEKDGLFYIRFDHLDVMCGSRPRRMRLWAEPLDD